MLDFLWHLSGSIVLTSAPTKDEILDRVTTALKDDGHPANKRGEDFVEFQTSLWQTGSRTAAMAGFDSGRIWVEQASYGLLLKYRLRSFQLLVFSLTFAIFGAVLFQTSFLGIFMFSVLYGGNLVLAIDRVANFLKRAADA
ncbi:hypothetical protein [Mesorhizobium sp. B2-7-1]|uniref:hypothetical protein n=1 Tax=Mesorhizobium sp. B2-7-1 TaxID=2589909 RepID=UPI00112694CE|nr:hypothetical protein [Mesorhizobium sp. B2-7-1]TPJ55042.1 hypothetical protein FJ471_25365 [Mesorhizobium sp. B2-7-1]